MERVDDLQKWITVAGPSETINSPNLHNGVWSAFTDFSGTVTVVNGAHTATIDHPDNYVVWRASLGADRLVIVDVEQAEGDYHLTVHNLNDHTKEVIEEWGGYPQRHDSPQITLDANWLMWTTSVDEGETCIEVRNLDTGAQATPVCSPRKGQLLRLPTLDWPNVVYRLDQVKPEPCMQLYTFELPDGEPTPVEHTRCFGWGGHRTADFTAWTEFNLESGDVYSAPLYAVDRHGATWSLGRTGVGATTACQDRLFWRKELVDYVEIRTWAPDEPIRVIFRSEPDWYPTTAPSCSDGWVTISNSFVGVGPVLGQVLAVRVSDIDQ